MDIIMIGEPGAYAVEGHLDDAGKIAMLRALLSLDPDECLDGLLMPRSTWLRVTDDGDETWYREVREGDDGAEPYTLIAVENEWISPDDRDQIEHAEWVIANERIALAVARMDPIDRHETAGRNEYSCRFCGIVATSRAGVQHRSGCEWMTAVSMYPRSAS